MKIKNCNKIIILILFFLSACSSIPKNVSNSCSIFDERYFWYKYSKKTEQKWGTPIHIQLAIIKMESDFDWLAKPPRQKIFKVIPFKRPSSSFGYSQAVKGTWEQYKKETGNKIATRARFKDSVDFIGWYTNKTETILKISKHDAFKQYMSYLLFPRFLNLSLVYFSFNSLIVVLHFYSLFRCRGFIHLSKEL